MVTYNVQGANTLLRDLVRKYALREVEWWSAEDLDIELFEDEADGFVDWCKMMFDGETYEARGPNKQMAKKEACRLALVAWFLKPKAT